MNLIDLVKKKIVFDILSEKMIGYSQKEEGSRRKRYTLETFSTRAIVRQLNDEIPSLRITNIKVTSKDKSKHIITFHSNDDRYYCIWDFAEGRYISRSVNR